LFKLLIIITLTVSNWRFGLVLRHWSRSTKLLYAWLCQYLDGWPYANHLSM